MIEFRTPPNDRRHFVHGRIKKAVTSFVTSGFNPVSAASGFLSSGAPSTQVVTAIQKVAGTNLKFGTATGATPMASLSRKTIHRGFHRARKIALKLGLPDPGHGRHADPSLGITTSPNLPDCFFGFKRHPVTGKCVPALGEQVGRDDTPIGDVIMGRYGAGEVPGNHVINRAVCRPGMVLGDDGNCYNRTQITNKQRAWPRGRRPLLTGGDMRAISTAARAGKRLEGATKRLQKMGMMKRAQPRRRLPAPAAPVHLIESGHHH